MKVFKKQCRFLLLALVLSVLSTSCTPMIGAPSLTLMTRDIQPDSPNIELIGGPDEASESLYWFLIFGMSGQQPRHESVVSRLIEKHNADILLDAELYTSNYGVPYIFMVFNTTIKGQPARVIEGGVK